jgi:chromosomal replication initiation ATPase DnaA
MNILCQPCNYHTLIGFPLRGNLKIEIEDYIKHGADFLCYNKNDIIGTSRKRDLTDCRHMIIAYLRIYKRLTYSQIGNKFNRDHTSILHATNTVMNLCETKNEYKIVFKSLVEFLNKI